MANRHGYVWCWGDNRLGQLGVGIAPTLPSSWRPMRLVSSYVYSQISAGGEHSCALTRYHQISNAPGATPGRAEIHCWGKNTRGQLGNLTTTTSGYPVRAIHPQVIAVVDLTP
jgi:alpha-tubulin suppressor-like RCC1 family protein